MLSSIPHNFLVTLRHGFTIVRRIGRRSRDFRNCVGEREEVILEKSHTKGKRFKHYVPESGSLSELCKHKVWPCKLAGMTSLYDVEEDPFHNETSQGSCTSCTTYNLNSLASVINY